MSINISTQRGEACRKIFDLGPGLVAITNVIISKRPMHGIAGTNKEIAAPGFAYIPAPGFVGKDEFVVTVETKKTASHWPPGALAIPGDYGRGKMDIHVDVDIENDSRKTYPAE